MPDLNNLAAFGSGLSKTLFGGLLQQRRQEEEDKVQEQVRRLAAYHALLEHPETPESEIPNILDSMAKEVKADKEFAPITAHMREGMKRRVPTGPSSEMPIQPTRGREVAGLPADTSQPSSVTVPGPTAEYGSLTQSEARRSAALQDYEAQSGIQTRKMLEQQAAMTDRAIQVEQAKEVARQARLETEYKLKRDLLEPKERLAADKQRSQYEQSLLAQLGHTPSDEEKAWARTKAGEMVINLADATLGQKAAAAEASRATAKNRLAQISHWNAQDAHAIRMEATQGLSAGALRVFNANTREVWPELSRVKSEIIRLQTLKAALGANNPQFDAQLQALEDRRDELQLKIDDERNALKSSSVPTGPQSSPRPKSDPLGLFP